MRFTFPHQNKRRHEPVRLEEHQCPALVPGARLQQDPKTGEPILLYPEGVIHLSETAHDMLLQCDGKTELRVLVGKLAAEYEVEPELVGKDVRECLLELIERNLIKV
jgi:pyrroloquinoline quinone biosynthesis protein D